jgi:hypothetical protein
MQSTAPGLFSSDLGLESGETPEDARDLGDESETEADGGGDGGGDVNNPSRDKNGFPTTVTESDMMTETAGSSQFGAATIVGTDAGALGTGALETPPTSSFETQFRVPISHQVFLSSSASKPTTALSVEPSGTRVASGGADTQVRLYDFGGMDQLHRFAP